MRAKLLKKIFEKDFSLCVDIFPFPSEKIYSSYDFIILDIREKAHQLLNKITYKKAVVLDCLIKKNKQNTKYIYTLPKPNSNDESWLKYLIIQPFQNGDDGSSDTFLVSFGGEDPYNISFYMLEEFLLYGDILANIFPNIKVIIVNNHIYNKYHNKKIKTYWGDIRIFPFSKHYPKLFAMSKNIITSFGNTLFEALRYKKNIFLINHTKYHNLLSLTTYNIIGGFLNLGHYKEVINPLYQIYEFFQKNIHIKPKKTIPDNGAKRLCIDILSFFYS